MTAPRVAFGLVLLLLASFYGVLLSHHWIPVHDGLFALNVLQPLLRHWTEFGVPALWEPTLNHGMQVHGFSVVIFSPANYLLLPLAYLLKPLNTVTFFYLSQCVNELLLLGGTFLLARECFKQWQSVLLVCVSVLGTTVWSRQPFLNFGSYYFLPFCFYLAVIGARRRSWQWAALSFLVYAFFVPRGFGLYPALPAGVLLGVFSFCLWMFPDKSGSRTEARQVPLSILVLLAASVVVALGICLAKGEVEFHSPLRTGLSSDYEQYLSYQKFPEQLSMAQLLFGIYTFNDSVSYGGLLIVPLVLTSLLFAFSRLQTAFLACALASSLLALGMESFAAPLLFQLPGFSVYRHLGHVTVLVRLVLIFVAGFGFERLQEVIFKRRKWKAPVSFFAILIGLMATRFLWSYWGSELITGERQKLLAVLLTCALVISLAPILARPMKKQFALGILLIAAVDVLSFRSATYHKELLPVSEAVWKTLTPQPIQWSDSRVRDPFSSPAFSAWAPLLKGRTHLGHEGFRLCAYQWKDCTPFSADSVGELYEVFSAMLGLETCLPLFRSDYALRGMAKFFRSHQIPVGTFHPLKEFGSNSVRQVFSDPAFLRSVACESSKIQLHRGAVANEGTPVSYEILGFDYNHLRLRLTKPVSDEVQWLSYADAWSKEWKASVDEVPTPVEQRGPYKAVKLPRGSQEIIFSYEPVWISIWVWANAFLSFLLMGGILFWVFQRVFQRQMKLGNIRSKARQHLEFL